MRRAFTLIEMTIVIAIIAILAGMALSVYSTALAQSKGMRTRAIIAKIDQLIGEKYEGYRTRQVPIRVAPGTAANVAAQIRVDALRELMRFEMPDRITDVTAGPAYVDPTNPAEQIPQAGYPVYPLYRLSARPAINKQYLRRAFKAHAPGNPGLTGLQYWTTQNENAECLYLILACSRDSAGTGTGTGPVNNSFAGSNDASALDFFSKTEIGDVDDDGMNEILDSFGQPIAFLRWAPGYVYENAVVTPQIQNPNDGNFVPDPFDPFQVYGSINFSLKPLIWSAGPDKRHDVNVGGGFLYATTTPPNDPYTNAGVIGTPMDTNADGSLDFSDNITNHDLEAR